MNDKLALRLAALDADRQRRTAARLEYLSPDPAEVDADDPSAVRVLPMNPGVRARGLVTFAVDHAKGICRGYLAGHELPDPSFINTDEVAQQILEWLRSMDSHIVK